VNKKGWMLRIQDFLVEIKRMSGDNEMRGDDAEKIECKVKMRQEGEIYD